MLHSPYKSTNLPASWNCGTCSSTRTATFFAFTCSASTFSTSCTQSDAMVGEYCVTEIGPYIPAGILFGSKDCRALTASMIWVCAPVMEIGEGGAGSLHNVMAWLAVVPLPAGQPVDAVTTAVVEQLAFACAAPLTDCWAFPMRPCRVTPNGTCPVSAGVTGGPSNRTT